MNKSNILVCVFFLVFLIGTAQEKPSRFLSQGIAWVDGFGDEKDGRYKIHDVKMLYYTSAGDTLINGKSYFRIRRSRMCKTYCEFDVDVEGNNYVRDRNLDIFDDTLQFFMREDEAGDVWFYTEDKSAFYKISGNNMYEYLTDSLVCRDLFLFNVKKQYAVGDILPLGMSGLVSYSGNNEGKGWGNRSVVVKNMAEKNLLDGTTHMMYNNFFLEGVGPLDGPLSGIGAPNCYCSDFNQLFAFYRNGLLVYRNEGYLSALEEHFPNILDVVTGKNKPDGLKEVRGLETKIPNTLYDLQGRRLPQAPQKGVYIQNGKVAIK